MLRKFSLMYIPLCLLLLVLLSACSAPVNGSPSSAGANPTTTVSTTTVTEQPTSAPTTTTPATTSTPAPATPTAQPQQTWNTYQDQDATFTISYPAGWSVSVTPAGNYREEITFRPTPTSLVSFTVDVLHVGEMTPNSLLHNDPFYQNNTISSQGTIPVDDMLWSTASGMTKGPQVEPSSFTLGYANDKRPFRVEFIAPPSQFAAYTQVFNAMFHSFQEL